jgi:L,D-peptidoglycan transpeptidase YkuD (ErfK/YbiS/YcfS/YnhG family)
LKKTFFIFTFFCLTLFGCVKEEPVPPEVDLAQAQELNLWRAGAHLYLQSPFDQYEDAFSQAKKNLIRINSRFSWFRDYQPVKAEFTEVLKRGEELLKELEAEKQKRARAIQERIKGLRETLQQIDAATRMINESGASRRFLTKAEIVLNEAQELGNMERYPAADEKLNEAQGHLAAAEKVINPILSRYRDEKQIQKWRKWAREAIEESRGKGIYSILVVKESKKLLLYKRGEVVKTYRIALGRNGWSDKHRAQDHATPEGRYRIVGKNPKSRFYLALLINYPNEEDRREFNQAKKKGLLPQGAKIGGLIEIHGGGTEVITYGCVALDDRQMQELYNLVEAGTPVAIVGALDNPNSLSSISAAIDRGRTQKETD